MKNVKFFTATHAILLSAFFLFGLILAGVTSASSDLTYDPKFESLTIAPGSSGSFTQYVTAQAGNGTFSVELFVAGNPTPSSWISASPSELSFDTDTIPPSDDTESWDIIVAVPSDVAEGTRYHVDIKANPDPSGVGLGSGTHLIINVSSGWRGR